HDQPVRPHGQLRLLAARLDVDGGTLGGAAGRDLEPQEQVREAGVRARVVDEEADEEVVVQVLVRDGGGDLAAVLGGAGGEDLTHRRGAGDHVGRVVGLGLVELRAHGDHTAAGQGGQKDHAARGDGPGEHPSGTTLCQPFARFAAPHCAAMVPAVQNRWDDQKAAALGDELAQLIYLSNLVGSDPTLTQPGGGNSSVKRREEDGAGRTVEVLRAKGSGTDLATIGKRGFTGLRRDDLALLERRDQMTDEEMMAFLRAGMLDGREPAPSVETPLHSVLPYRFIVHTHDFATQALTDTSQPEGLVREVLGAEAAYIDYVRPGFPLARAVIRQGR